MKPQIESTMNYAQFTFDKSNRLLDPRKLEKLTKSIERVNLLELYPIIVRADGVVLDGQHRLKVAERLGLLIYYIIADTMTIEDVAAIAGTPTAWKKTDFLNHWCAQGIEDYIFLRELSVAYPDHHLTTLTSLLMYGNRIGLKETFEHGMFKAIRRRYAVVVLDAAKSFQPIIPKWYREQTFVMAVGNLFDHQGYSHERMLKQVMKQSARLTKQIDVKTYLIVFQDIYNYGRPEKTHMIFKPRDHYRGDSRYVYPE